MACLCLHRYLRKTENSLNTPQGFGFVDVELADSNIKKGDWRTQAGQDGCLKLMKPQKGGRRKIVTNKLREHSKHFVNNEIGSVP